MGTLSVSVHRFRVQEKGIGIDRQKKIRDGAPFRRGTVYRAPTKDDIDIKRKIFRLPLRQAQGALENLFLENYRIPRQANRWLGWLLVAMLTTACQPSKLAADEPVNVTIAGSSAMRPVLFALTKEFSRQHPHLLFDIVGGGSTVGETRVQLGQVDLAASTLISPTINTPIVVSNRNATAPANGSMRIPVGLDGIVVIVHPINPLDDLSLAQLRDLFSGRIWNWQTLGGPDETVLLVVREDGSGARVLFDDRVMGQSPVALTAVVMPTSTDVIDYVARHPEAIGYVSRAHVIELLNQTAPNDQAAPTLTAPQVRLVSIEGQLPTLEALDTQRYFLIQPLYLVSQGQPRGWPKQFVDFVLSPAGQTIVARYHLPIR